MNGMKHRLVGCRSGLVQMPATEPDVLRALLEYLYTGHVTLSDRVVMVSLNPIIIC